MLIVRNEPEILGRLQHGDITALEAVYTEYGSALYAFSLSICKSRETAEDAVEELFVMLYQYLSAGKPITNLKSFLFTACRNKTLDLLRDAPRNVPLPDDDVLIKLELPLEEKTAVRFALEKLPPDEREIVLLHCSAGFLHREIAEILNLAEGTVRWKYRKAIATLKSQLGGAERA